MKHDIAFLGHLDNGLRLYRFSYNGSEKAYVGVIAQEVQFVRPDAVSRDADGILRVHYDRLGVRFQTYDQWLRSRGRLQTNLTTSPRGCYAADYTTNDAGLDVLGRGRRGCDQHIRRDLHDHVHALKAAL